MEENVKYPLIGFVWLMLCPLLALPYIVWGIYHQRKGAFLLFSLLLGIFAFISFPSEDLYRHYFIYTFLSVRPIGAITWIEITLNGMIPYVYWFMSHTGITFGWLRFVELTLGFYLLSLVFRYLMDQCSYNNNERFIRFILLFLYFDFLYTTMGVKFGFALCLYIYSLHQLINLQQIKKGLFWLLFCCCWHLSFVFTAPAIFVLYKLNLSRTKALWLCLALAIIMPIFIHIAGSLLLGRRFDFYFSKKADDVTSYAAMTPIGLALYILPKLTIVPLVIILLKNYTADSKWCRIALGWLILAIALMSNAVTFYRFWWAFMSVGILAFLELEMKVVIQKRTLQYLLLAGVGFTILNMMTYHKEVMYSPYYKSLWPAPLVLSQDYEKQEVYYIIQHDGDFR